MVNLPDIFPLTMDEFLEAYSIGGETHERWHHPATESASAIPSHFLTRYPPRNTSAWTGTPQESPGWIPLSPPSAGSRRSPLHCGNESGQAARWSGCPRLHWSSQAASYSPNTLLKKAREVKVIFCAWSVKALMMAGWQCPWLTAEYADRKSK